MRYAYDLFTWIIGDMHIKAITKSQWHVDPFRAEISTSSPPNLNLTDGQLMRWARGADGKLSNSTITISIYLFEMRALRQFILFEIWQGQPRYLLKNC